MRGGKYSSLFALGALPLAMLLLMWSVSGERNGLLKTGSSNEYVPKAVSAPTLNNTAGSPVPFCGHFHKTPAITVVDSSKTYYMDNHGNWYEESEIMLPVDTTSSGQLLASACGCDEFDDQEVPFQSESYFNLVFVDCLESTQIGFDDPLLGRERRRVACKAYAYLARLISQEENPCSPGSPPKVNIEVSSFFDSGTPSNPTPLGIGSAILRTKPIGPSDGGILDAQASRVIQNSCNVVNAVHAKVRINFHYSFFLGDDENGIGANEYDLYTVVN